MTPIEKVTLAINSFGEEVLNRTDKGNAVFSPYSLSSALTMTTLGARSETEEEMRRALGFDLSLSRQEIAKAFQEIIQAHREEAPGVTIIGGNALATMPNTIALQPDYIRALETMFHAELLKNATLSEVNAWAKKNTKDKIPTVLESLSPDAICVILNALYFKGRWTTPFKASNTKELGFHTPSGETINVPTMYVKDEFKYSYDNNWALISLPYGPESYNRYEMVLGMPAREDSNGMGFAPALAAFSKMNSFTRDCIVRLPKFKIESSPQMVPILMSLGMEKCFNYGADFSAMGGSFGKDLKIDDVAHKAVIEVNEEGTEAAAATAVVMSYRSCVMNKIPEFNFDRKFFFAVVNKTTNAVLFMGKVENPIGG